MFTDLFNIMGKATISLTIAKTGANELTVGITPKSEGSEMVPAVITGSPQELEAGFVGAIQGLVQDTEHMILKKDALKASLDSKKTDTGKKKTFPEKVAEKATEALKKETPKPEPKPTPDPAPVATAQPEPAPTPAPVESSPSLLSLF